MGDEGNAAPGGAAGVKDGKGGTGESSVGSGRSIPIRQVIEFDDFSLSYSNILTTICKRN